MKSIVKTLLMIAAIVFSGSVVAQQSQDFGNYVVHYNALNTNLIPPQVAKGYGIVRSPSRALLNITVMKKVMDLPAAPVAATVSTRATNLTGQLREIDMREIREAEAIYYIGEFPVHNLETYQFEVSVSIAGEAEPLMVRFRQQFFTE